MVLAVDEDDGSVRALIRFLPIVAIERAAVNALVPCRIPDLDASFAPTSMPRRGERSRLAFFPHSDRRTTRLRAGNLRIMILKIAVPAAIPVH